MVLDRNEKKEIAKRLRITKESELSRDELEQMLDAELDRQDDEVITELVEEILELLEIEPNPAQQREAWEKTSKQLKRKQRKPFVTGLTRIAAACVILVALVFATYGTARALNWEFLLRLMKPFAETFMLYSGDDPVATTEPENGEVYLDTAMESAKQAYATLDDCPDEIDGYPAKPAWMPERFAYVQGSSYADMHVTSYSHLFSSGDGSCIVDVTKFRNNEDATSYYYEQLPEDNTTVLVAEQSVSLSHNTHNVNLTASWLVDNTHYCVTGVISEEEAIKIIEDILK